MTIDIIGAGIGGLTTAIAYLSNPILIAIRNQMLRLSPSSINRKQSEQIFELARL